MTRHLPRCLRLDPSDTVIFEQPAEPGEWAVPGGFEFWDTPPETLSGKRRQAFRGGFLGLSSFGWSTLVEVAEVSEVEHAAALAALARRIRTHHGAPDDAAAMAAAREELAFAESLCNHPPGTVLALSRRIEEGEVRESFRTLHRRETPHTQFTTLPVFSVVEDEPPEHPDLTAFARRLKS
ncbi:DUF6505 family protein [Roseomonas sp. F4]